MIRTAASIGSIHSVSPRKRSRLNPNLIVLHSSQDIVRCDMYTRQSECALTYLFGSRLYTGAAARGIPRCSQILTHAEYLATLELSSCQEIMYFLVVSIPYDELRNGTCIRAVYLCVSVAGVRSDTPSFVRASHALCHCFDTDIRNADLRTSRFHRAGSATSSFSGTGCRRIGGSRGITGD